MQGGSIVDTVPCRVFICDDVPEIRSAISDALQYLPTFTTVGEAGDGPSCIAGVTHSQPEILILDVGMPGGGPELVASLKSTAPDLRIIVFTAYGDAETRASMIHAGVDDFVVKTGRLQPLRDALLKLTAR